MMLRKKIFIIILLVAFWLVGCGAEDSQQANTENHEEEHSVSGAVELSAEQMELMKIEIGEPQLRQLGSYLTAPAKVEPVPERIANIGTLISGRVKKIHVTPGERVEKGQVLLEIQGLEIGEIKGEYIRGQAVLEFAKANFERQQKLLQENIASQRAYFEAQAAYEEAKAVFSAAGQKLHSIGISAEEARSLIMSVVADAGHTDNAHEGTLKITSPISGVVGKYNVILGQFVQPDSDVMEVLDSRQVWVVADIYEKDLAGIQPNQKVEVITQAFPENVYVGKLEYINPIVDAETRTVKVLSTIENRDSKLKPEMFATMRIYSSSLTPSLVVPESAVENDGEVSFVFVLSSSHEVENLEEQYGHEDTFHFQKLPIQTGLRQDGHVEITAGLTGNEKIVVKGAFFLKSELLKESFGEHGH